MKTLFTTVAAAALLAGVSIAAAQSGSTPGAGSPGQNQKGGDASVSGPSAPPGSAQSLDKPPSEMNSGGMNAKPATTGAGTSGQVNTPAKNESGSATRDSRGLPTTTTPAAR